MHFARQAQCQKDAKRSFFGSLFAKARVGFHFTFIFCSFSVSFLRKMESKWNGKWWQNDSKMNEKWQPWTTLMVCTLPASTMPKLTRVHIRDFCSANFSNRVMLATDQKQIMELVVTCQWFQKCHCWNFRNRCSIQKRYVCWRPSNNPRSSAIVAMHRQYICLPAYSASKFASTTQHTQLGEILVPFQLELPARLGAASAEPRGGNDRCRHVGRPKSIISKAWLMQQEHCIPDRVQVFNSKNFYEAPNRTLGYNGGNDSMHAFIG